eukprot:CAMPEP_0176435634 /NCGR_PEP_ID=MMETSP0127-20121128/17451_1 /TAXON_ID=938130 /ORGANISM="Platyophrya macrostoma, Strain WH" /LENGTH=286 /DNA_ID=CAMNT_0017818723 /DNA_START=28 /DNA_END=888 /DNA_ORIENTATION=+
MLQRPSSTLVQDPSYPHRLTHKATPNGAAQAAKETFHVDSIIEDPQMDGPVSLGTTIMAVSYAGGVVLAADSRTSSGSYVVNRVSNKLTKLTSKIYCCRSGSAADTQALAEMVSNYLESLSLETNEEVRVASAASVFHKLCFSNKWNISAGIIVAGYDSVNGGSVYSIPSGGSCVKLDYAIGGSGSIFLYSFFDANYKPGMTKEQCLNFVRTAVSHAYARDGSSGGVVRTIALDAGAVEHSTTPWPAAPYAMERDPKYAALAPQNQPFSSTAKTQDNQADSTAENV